MQMQLERPDLNFKLISFIYMAEQKQETKNIKEEAKSDTKDSKSVKSDTRHTNTGRSRGQSRRRQRSKSRKPSSDLDNKIISIRRVSHSYKGGKRLHLSVCVVVGDRKGRVGVGTARGSDVRSAQTKAIADAKKNMVMVPIKGNTIPHGITHKKGAAKIFIKPASPGTGLIAGSSARTVYELAGIKDILSKLLGSRNQINNAYTAVEALKSVRSSKL